MPNGKLRAGTQRVKGKVLNKIKQLLRAKKVAIKGTGKYGARIQGKGAYTISEIGAKVAEPFFDDTRSKGAVNKIARFAGKSLGGMVGLGDEVGNASSWLSRAFGFGDYTIKKNSFQDYGNIAQFANHGTITFSHREFIADIKSTTGFVNQSFPINPGNSTLFPWLSTVAKNFEQYEFLGLIFEFKSTSATAVGSVNTGLGTVIMATDYDVLDSKYADKRAMEVSEFATSAAPYNSQVHPIECDPKQNVMRQLFIQAGNVVANYPDDPRFSALGNFQIATSGMQAVSTIGELWVSYHIKLLKPQLEANQTGSTTSIHAQVKADPGGSPSLTKMETTNPGAIAVDILAGPSRIRYMCMSIAGLGQYLLTNAIVSDASNPTYTCSGDAYTTSGVVLSSLATGITGVANSRQIIGEHYPTLSANATFGKSNNPCEASTIFRFVEVGDSIEIPIVYSVAATVYTDSYLAPYQSSFVASIQNSVQQSADQEWLAFRKQLTDMQASHAELQNNFIALKDEIKDELQDNEYEVTVGEKDVSILIDKLANANLLNCSSSEVDENLKATVEMLGRNLSLSDRIRLEHYYTNLKKFRL